LSLFLKIANHTKKLISSQDVVDAILKQQEISNNEREKIGLEPIVTIPVIHNFINEKFINKLVVVRLKNYYNFFTNKHFELSSVIFSDLREPINIPYKILENLPQKQKKKTENKSIDEKPLESENKMDLDFLDSRHKKINKLISLKGDFFKRQKTNNK
jgi:hypothetical protein